jgi:hypothetical protein
MAHIAPKLSRIMAHIAPKLRQKPSNRIKERRRTNTPIILA